MKINNVINMFKFIFLYVKYKINIKMLNIERIKINTEFENKVFYKILKNHFKIHKSIIEKLKTHNIKFRLTELHIYNLEVTALKTNFKCIFSCNKCNVIYSCTIYPDINEIYSYGEYRILTCKEQIIKNLIE